MKIKTQWPQQVLYLQLAATICSGIGIAKTKEFDGNGKGFAIAGLIIGIFSIIYGIYSIANLSDILSDLDSLSILF